jgi:hypothetical protein
MGLDVQQLLVRLDHQVLKSLDHHQAPGSLVLDGSGSSAALGTTRSSGLEESGS